MDTFADSLHVFIELAAPAAALAYLVLRRANRLTRLTLPTVPSITQYHVASKFQRAGYNTARLYYGAADLAIYAITGETRLARLLPDGQMPCETDVFALYEVMRHYDADTGYLFTRADTEPETIGWAQRLGIRICSPDAPLPAAPRRPLYRFSAPPAAMALAAAV